MRSEARRPSDTQRGRLARVSLDRKGGLPGVWFDATKLFLSFWLGRFVSIFLPLVEAWVKER